MIQLSRRTLALILAAFLALTAIATTSLVLTLTGRAEAGAGFTDTRPWIAAHAEWLQDNGIAGGFGDGTFGPKKNITRGQAAYWFGNYNDAIEVVESASLPNPFPVTHANSTIRCPPGKRAIAGGATEPPGFVLAASYPDNSASQGEWTVTWVSRSGSALDWNALPKVFATCVPNTIP